MKEKVLLSGNVRYNHSQQDIGYACGSEAGIQNGKEYGMGYLICETTREERERIVEEALGTISGSCDGCMAGLSEMYQDYIDGKRELRDINMSFTAHYESGGDQPAKAPCGEMNF